MSSVARAAAVLLLLTASRGVAQGNEDGSLRAAQERRVDSLGAIARAALARLTAFDDSVGRLRRTLDSVDVPPFRMLVEPDLVPMAGAAARRAAGHLRERAGTTVAAVASRRLVVRTERGRDGNPDPIVIAFLDTSGREVSQLWGRADTVTLARWMTQNGFAAINAAMAPELRDWLETSLHFDSLTATNWSFVRVALVSSPATIARRCFAGDMRSCRLSLGLDSTRDRAREWYDAPARVALVRDREWHLGRTDDRATRACLEGDDAACVALLNKSDVMEAPGSNSARASLAQLAVQLGGVGAIERLLLTPGGPGRRLEAASGMSLDSLVGEWHRRMQSARLPSSDISPMIIGASLAWLLVFGALSLRSSRWR